MSTKIIGGFAVLLLIVIGVMAWIVFATPTPAHAPTTATNPPSGDMPPAGGEGGAGQTPLNERLVISSPVAGSTVGHSFAVAGSAPGPWFFEASFPVQVRDGSGNVIGRAVATAGGDWMTEGPVPFTASVTVDAGFSGRATLVLLKDNPSGLPENDDAVEISIVIQ